MEISIPLELWLIFFILLVSAVGILYFYFSKKGIKKKDAQAYLLGLKYLAEGENRRAIEKFKEAVRLDSDNVDAYLKIGNILRTEGLYNNAIRIHKDLTLRGNLEADELLVVKRDLALDYWYANNYEKAEIYLNDLRADKNYSEWAIPFLVKIYEKREAWGQAFNLLRQSTSASGTQSKAKLAIYKVLQGLNLSEKDEKNARVLFKEAIKIDERCSAPYIYLGDSYWREHRTSDAISAWNNLCKKVPDKAYYVFERLEKALYEKGQFSKIEELYLGILSSREDDIYAIIALSEIYRKKGEYDESLRLLEHAQKKEVDIDLLHAQQIKVLIDKEQHKKAAQIALELIERNIQPLPKNFSCLSCGYKTPEPFWICPKCGEWVSNI